MAFDYRKEYREYYLPKGAPGLVTVPPMNFVAVRGEGDPNEEDGAYQRALNQLYGVAYTLKMSPRAGRAIEGFFDYVVPPLEGLWRQKGTQGMDYARKGDLVWIAMIRLPDFITREDFDWAVGEAARKKKADFSAAEFFRYDEGLCVQCLHVGPYDDEAATVARMERFMEEQGLVPDFNAGRHHHEIYLGDPRRTAPEKLKTVIRHPVKRV